jgi:hypothetical protein
MQVPPWPRNSDAQNLQKLMDPTSVASTKPQPMAPLCVMRSTKEVRRTMNQSGNRKKNPGKMGRLSRGTPACPACLYMGSNGENGNKIKEKHHTISEGGSSILLGPPADTGPCTCLLALKRPSSVCSCARVSTGQHFAFSQATQEAYGRASWGRGMDAKGQQKPRSHAVRTKRPQEGTRWTLVHPRLGQT